MPHQLKLVTLDMTREVYPVFAPPHAFSPNLVPDAYLAGLEPVVTDGVKKVQVRLTHDPAEDGRYEDFGDVVQISRYFEPAAYAELGVVEAKRHLLELIHTGVRGVAERRSWATDALDAAYEATLAAGVVLNGFLGRGVRGPTGRTARLHYDYRRGIDVDLVLFSRLGEEQARIPLASLPAGLDIVTSTFGPISWVSDDGIEVLHKNRQDRWIVSVSEGNVDFVTARAARGDPHGQYDLGMLYANGRLARRDVKKARLWLERAARQGFKRATEALARLDAAVLD